MRYTKILPISTLCVLLLESTHGFAATNSEAKLENQLHQISNETVALQQEITALKSELSQVKRQKSSKQVVVVRQSSTSSPSSSRSKANPNLRVSPRIAKNSAPTAIANSGEPGVPIIAGPNITTTAAGLPSGYQPGDIISPSVALNAEGHPILTAEQEVSQEREADVTYLMGSYVMTSQILNIQSAFDASDLVVNQSTMNEDLRFLLQRQELQHIVGIENLPSVHRPQVFLSGKVEPLFIYSQPFGGTSPASSGSTSIDLSSVELDTLAEASDWAYAFTSLNLETNRLRNPSTIGSGNPLNNSRIFLKRGFITIGNLDKSPFYFSAGQEYVPFGRYTSYMLSNPDTLSEGRINARAAVLGFYNRGLYLSTYALNGAADTPSGFDANHVYEWGGNGGYKYAFGKLTGQFGAGYTTNIAEAQGYQLTGLSTSSFAGFSANPTTELLQHPVGGFNAHVQGNMGPINLISEYITATKAFAPEDLTFNGEGARPKALHNEADITFNNVFSSSKSIALFLAYDHAWQSLALNIPQNSYIAGLSTSLWKNTIEAIEYRHDVNYNSNDTASGICDPNNTGIASTCPVTVLGHNQNQVLVQFGTYF